MSVPRVSVVLVSYNTRDDLLRALRSVQAHAGLPSEVVVVDNASGDGSAEAVRAAHPGATVLANPRNVGFGAACNRGIAASSGPFVLLLNSDAELRPGALPALVAVLDTRPEVGIVGPRTRHEDGAIELSFGPPLALMAEWRQRRRARGLRQRRPEVLASVEAQASVEHEPGWVSGACLLARRAALEAVSGFDEAFFLYEEDVDLCVRVRAAGWRILFTPGAEVVHRGGRSMAAAPAAARLAYQRSHLRYYRKHNGRGAQAVLRGLLALRAVAGLLGGPARRAEAAAQLALALRGS